MDDILNEEALKIKCLSLCKMGKMGPAKKVFDKFAYEYEKSMGITFRNSFNDFVLINH